MLEEVRAKAGSDQEEEGRLADRVTIISSYSTKSRAILWLLSDEASYTTGAILDVSGGR
jgi:NAD(P)-dependent dehydrogenase (short-subunit alcohol dehydrogenase family)